MFSGDELLEVNGIQLFGVSHVEVRRAMSSLPGNCAVRLVVARKNQLPVTVRRLLERETYKSSNCRQTSFNLPPPLLNPPVMLSSQHPAAVRHQHRRMSVATTRTRRSRCAPTERSLALLPVRPTAIVSSSRQRVTRTLVAHFVCIYFLKTLL